MNVYINLTNLTFTTIHTTIHGYRSGLLDPGLGRYIILAPKRRPAVEGRSAYILAPKRRPAVQGRSAYILAPKLRTAVEGRSEIRKLIYWILKYSKVL